MANVKVIEATSEHYNRTRGSRNENVLKILRVVLFSTLDEPSIFTLNDTVLA